MFQLLLHKFVAKIAVFLGYFKENILNFVKLTQNLQKRKCSLKANTSLKF